MQILSLFLASIHLFNHDDESFLYLHVKKEHSNHQMESLCKTTESYPSKYTTYRIKIAIDSFNVKHYEIRRFFHYIHEFALSSN